MLEDYLHVRPEATFSVLTEEPFMDLAPVLETAPALPLVPCVVGTHLVEGHDQYLGRHHKCPWVSGTVEDDAQRANGGQFLTVLRIVGVRARGRCLYPSEDKVE